MCVCVCVCLKKHTKNNCFLLLLCVCVCVCVCFGGFYAGVAIYGGHCDNQQLKLTKKIVFVFFAFILGVCVCCVFFYFFWRGGGRGLCGRRYIWRPL